MLGFDEIFRKIDETIAVGGNQLLLQGGHNPDLPIAWYEDLFRAVKARYPDFKLHALSPPEVLHISRINQMPVPAVIERLVAAGLDSIPGGGAEILVDRVRKLLNCYSKASADEWLDVMRHAHRAGLRTTATMMYGTVETDEERIEHMMRLRDLQDETGGFTAFITWSYQPEHTERGGTEATGVDYLRTLALARIVLDNFDNLQASWVTQGGKVGQLSLAYGANDMGSVMIEENVVRAAGAALLHGRSRDRRQHRGRRLHSEAAEHALRDPRRSDLPRARRAADAGAGHGARGRRHVGAGGAPPVPGAQPGRQAAATRPVRWPSTEPTGSCPIAGDPIRDGWVARRGRPHRGGQRDAARPAPIDLGSAVILPALVNAHTHLELSYLRGVVPPSARFLDWIAAIMAARRRYADPQDPVILAAARAGIDEARASGTGLVGDISNTLVTVPLLREAAMPARVFYELLGFNVEDPGGARPSGAGGRGSRRRRRRRCPVRPRAACAVFGVARPFHVDPRRSRRACRRRLQRAPRRIAGRGRVPRARHGTVARPADDAGCLDRRVEGAGRLAGAVPRRRSASSIRACSPSTACSSTATTWRGCARSGRRSCRVRAATATSASAIRRSRRSTRWA